MSRTRRGLMLVIPALVLAAGGCGTESEPREAAQAPVSTSPSESPSDSSPSCAAVWQEGSDLPDSYRGCTEAEEWVDPEIVDCSSGQRIVVFADEFWAVRGHVISRAPAPLKESAEFQRVLRSCRA